ncbi:MAG: HAD-IC family P-type ATPase, partial [Betaproteobacteria bacterium]
MVRINNPLPIEYRIDEFIKKNSFKLFHTIENDNLTALFDKNGFWFDEKTKIEKPDNVEELPGKGMRVKLGTKTIVSGNALFVESTGVVFDAEIREILITAEKAGLNVTIFGLDSKVVGIITSADELRPDVKTAIQKLKTLGVESIVMLTGDNENVASRIASSVGITEYHAHMLPEEKLEYVKLSANPKKRLAMVGDGVNDAAALSLADIGIAMGTIGSDSAIEAADVALMKDDFAKIPEMIELGRDTMRVVKQNFAIWGSVNIVGLVLVSMHILGPEGAAA